MRTPFVSQTPLIQRVIDSPGRGEEARDSEATANRSVSSAPEELVTERVLHVH
jgi:hypothetical protein